MNTTRTISDAERRLKQMLSAGRVGLHSDERRRAQLGLLDEPATQASPDAFTAAVDPGLRAGGRSQSEVGAAAGADPGLTSRPEPSRVVGSGGRVDSFGQATEQQSWLQRIPFRSGVSGPGLYAGGRSAWKAAQGAFTGLRGATVGLSSLLQPAGEQAVRSLGQDTPFAPQEFRSELERIAAAAPELSTDTVANSWNAFKEARDKGASMDEAITAAQKSAGPVPPGYWGIMEIVAESILIPGGGVLGALIRRGAVRSPVVVRQLLEVIGRTVALPETHPSVRHRRPTHPRGRPN
jgi:hypothetical protein